MLRDGLKSIGRKDEHSNSVARNHTNQKDSNKTQRQNIPPSEQICKSKFDAKKEISIFSIMRNIRSRAKQVNFSQLAPLSAFLLNFRAEQDEIRTQAITMFSLRRHLISLPLTEEGQTPRI